MAGKEEKIRQLQSMGWWPAYSGWIEFE